MDGWMDGRVERWKCGWREEGRKERRKKGGTKRKGRKQRGKEVGEWMVGR